MIFDAQVAVTVVVAARVARGAGNQERGALLPATVAARGLSGGERGEEPVGEFGAFVFLRALVGFGHGG